MSKAEKAHPIQYGELYPGTCLRRRYQNGSERCPEYQGTEQTVSARFDAACAQLAETGHRAFCDAFDGSTYAAFGGQWFRLGGY